MIEIRKIDVSEAKILSELAIEAYSDHYLDFWHDNGKWYINKCFTIKQLESELVSQNIEYYFAMLSQKPIGFLKIRPQNQLFGQDGNGFEIERIYFINAVTGKGFGQILMQFAIEKAIELEKDFVWLKAMDSSQKAISFYKNLGFEICGTSKLDFETIKEELRGMVIMKKNI